MTDAKRVLVIPAYDEAPHLAGVLEDILEAADGFDVVVVDDGSSDRTGKIASETGVRVLRHPYNLGYGAALQTGYKYALRAGATLLVQMDADGQHEPSDIRVLCEPVERGELDLVIGSRFLGDSTYPMGAMRDAGRQFFRAAAGAFGLRVSDPTSGFQAMNRRALRLYAGDFFPTDYPDVDSLLVAQRAGLRLGERPVSMTRGVRPSSLHAGLAPIYYVYKMLLSLWAASTSTSDALENREGER